ncbi:MAG: hypothetical protein K2J17_02990, partial [Paramuribaculum sp.]|nr:hypothetical protein [Paramuribaculum sp.]
KRSPVGGFYLLGAVGIRCRFGGINDQGYTDAKQEGYRSGNAEIKAVAFGLYPSDRRLYHHEGTYIIDQGRPVFGVQQDVLQLGLLENGKTAIQVHPAEGFRLL